MTSLFDLDELLSPRILHHCKQKFLDNHYDSAAHAAMIQVEKALDEKNVLKGKDKKLSGQALVSKLFSVEGEYIKLIVPFPNVNQNDVKNFFKGAFGYYRNHTAHDGTNITKEQSLRILIIASELLDLIDASYLSFEDLGGIDGLLKYGCIQSKEDAISILEYLDGNCGPAGDPGGFEVNMLMAIGYDLEIVNALHDLNVISYAENLYVPTIEESLLGLDELEIYSYELTDLGKEYLRKLCETLEHD